MITCVHVCMCVCVVEALSQNFTMMPQQDLTTQLPNIN